MLTIMNKTPFSEQLSNLRQEAQLTNQELADLAKVPASLIAGLQSGKRRIGEYQSTKIGKALDLEGRALEEFIYSGIDTCSEKVLKDFVAYPAELLNLLARILKHAGIGPHQISHCTINEGGADILLANGSKAKLVTQFLPA